VRRTAVAILVAIAALVPAGAAQADEPLFVDWSSLLPSFTTGYQPTSANDCVAGRPQCLKATLKEMRRRFEPLARACDHDAVFALAYLRTTETYGWAAAQDGFFADTPFVNHEDAVFARYYFEAQDAWEAGRTADVPAAWRIAFGAAADRRVSGLGNLFLGMNAHVNRDLPYVLAEIGLVAPDGSSRKPDHDRVNQFLNAVLDPLLGEVAARFDAGADDLRDPFLLGYTTSFQLLAAWREAAWRNAELLVAAGNDPIARAAVEASIETYAATTATLLRTATSYTWPFTSSAGRDRHCLASNGATAPIDYTWGAVQPW
jgi:hypothetical protein